MAGEGVPLRSGPGMLHGGGPSCGILGNISEFQRGSLFFFFCGCPSHPQPMQSLSYIWAKMKGTEQGVQQICAV